MNSLLKKTVAILFCVVALYSCSEPLDFDQVNDLEAIPSYEASILYLESTEAAINDADDEISFSDAFNFGAFSTDIFADRVLDGSITYVLENTTSKELAITIDFLDESNTITDTTIFRMPPEPSAVLSREVVYGPSGKDINIIKTLAVIRVTARNLGDTSSVSSLSDPLITLKSRAKFRVELE